MPLKTKHLKNISALLALFLVTNLVAQEGVKIDGVAVVIGKNIVLSSDIQKFKEEIKTRSEGKVEISDCEMLEDLMQQKLLAHHAVIDSVTVTQQEIDQKVQRTIAYFTQEHGSVDKMIAAYGFNDLQDLKKELNRVQKQNILVNKEQAKITEKIDVTPEEVRIYYKSLEDSNSLPEIPEEVQIAQLVIKAKPKEGEEERIVKKLTEIKKELEDGAGFRLKAIIHSMDPTAVQNGGKLGLITKETNFIKEFKEAAFSLEEGEISDPIKTDFGYHLILVSKVRGNAREVSHILMRPEITDEAVEQAKNKAKEIKKDIEENKITFKEAVKKYSEDLDTKNNDGLIINPYTGESVFEPTRMNDPALYARINGLKKGEMSEVFYDETREGEKMYKFIFMKDKTNTHKADLVVDYVKLQQLALLKKKEETIEKWSKDKIQETYIKLGEDYKKCSFKKDWKKENK